MAVPIEDVKCSNCGCTLSGLELTCPVCGQPMIVKNISSLLGMTPLALNARRRLMESELQRGVGMPFAADANFTIGCCLLLLKMFDQSIVRFAKAIDTNPYNAEAFFCMAIAVLKGRRPILTPLANIKNAQQNIDAAAMIEERSLFRYFMAYIKYDFYARQFLRVTPNWQWELQRARMLGITDKESVALFAILGQECPREFVE